MGPVQAANLVESLHRCVEDLRAEAWLLQLALGCGGRRGGQCGSQPNTETSAIVQELLFRWNIYIYIYFNILCFVALPVINYCFALEVLGETRPIPYLIWPEHKDT